MEKFVKIGIVPIKRGFTDMVSALEEKNLFLNKCRQIAPDAVALCDLEGVLPEASSMMRISWTLCANTCWSRRRTRCSCRTAISATRKSSAGWAR